MTTFTFMGWVPYDGVTVALLKPVEPDNRPAESRVDFKTGDIVQVTLKVKEK